MIIIMIMQVIVILIILILISNNNNNRCTGWWAWIYYCHWVMAINFLMASNDANKFISVANRW